MSGQAAAGIKVSRPKRILLCAILGLCPLVISNSVFSAELDEISKAVIHSKDNKLSFYFQNIEVRSLLQLIAKSSGLN